MAASSRPDSEPTMLSDHAFEEFLVPAPDRRKPRWLLWLLIPGGLLGMLCFGGCLVFSLFCEAKQAATPAEVLLTAADMTDLVLPDGYEGELAETIVTPLFVARRAVFRHTSGKGKLSLTSIQIHWISPEEEAEATQGALDQMAGEMHQIVADGDSTQSLTIRGEPAVFHLRSGTDALSSTKYHEVRGGFRGKTGRTQLWLQAEDSAWNADDVDRLLNSLASPDR